MRTKGLPKEFPLTSLEKKTVSFFFHQSANNGSLRGEANQAKSCKLLELLFDEKSFIERTANPLTNFLKILKYCVFNFSKEMKELKEIKHNIPLIFHFFLEVPLETNPKKSIDTCHFPFICSLQALKHDDLYFHNKYSYSNICESKDA